MHPAGGVSDEAWAWWSEELRALDEGLGKRPQAAGARRLLSTIRNNHGEQTAEHTTCAISPYLLATALKISTAPQTSQGADAASLPFCLWELHVCLRVFLPR